MFIVVLTARMFRVEGGDKGNSLRANFRLRGLPRERLLPLAALGVGGLHDQDNHDLGQPGVHE